MTDLLSCPFCGGEAEMVVDEDGDGRFAAVACPSCGAGSRQHYFCGEDAREYAITAWNTRPDTPARPDREAVARIVERIIIRRLYKDRIDGYTLEMSLEIADAIALLPPADGWRSPEGWKLVPIAHTDEMEDAGRSVVESYYDGSWAGVTASEVYLAMLAASPAPPAAVGVICEQSPEDCCGEPDACRMPQTTKEPE